MSTLFEPPFPPYDPTDKAGFSYETVVKRWPVIVTGIIDRLHRDVHELSIQVAASGPERDTTLAVKIEEGKEIISKISGLKYDMGRDHRLDPVENDGESLVDVYNEELKVLEKKGKATWFTAPWLFAECYLYRVLRSYFAVTKHWRTYDPFLTQKTSTFQHSRASIYQIATLMHDIESEKAALSSDEGKLAVLFEEMLQMCLWGNATDLSLLTHLSADDISNLQSVGREAHETRKKFILRDDAQEAWKHLESLSDKNDVQVDFVLDNSGFELFTDFVFADFLVTYTPHVSTVIFHPKLIPWFVSDVTPPDFTVTIDSLLDQSFFMDNLSGPISAESKTHLQAMVNRWKSYLESGSFVLSVPASTPLGGSVDNGTEFWTSPFPYWNMQKQADVLWRSLTKSSLVIFKGDLNYRKLTGDVAWPPETPFHEALGPLAGSFPLLALRTNKADVVVGVDKDVAAKLDEKGRSWRYSGRYAVISFLPKT